MPAETYWDKLEEEAYRSDWDRAINGPRGAAQRDAARRNATAAYSRRLTPTPSTVPAASPLPVASPVPAKKRSKRKATGFYIFLSWTALFAWMAFIYYMSSHTSSDLAQGIFAHIRHYIEQFVWTYYGYVEDPVSPICHFGEYFILGALLGNALHCHMPFIPATLLAIAAASGYGYTDEIHQLSVAGRMFDLEDWKIDTIAAAFGSFLMLFFFFIGSRRR